MRLTECCHKLNNKGTKFQSNMMIVTKIPIKDELLKESTRLNESFKAAISPGRSYNLAESEACVRPAWLGSAQLVIFVVPVADRNGMKRRSDSQGLQVIIPDSLESVVAMEIIAADIVC